LPQEGGFSGVFRSTAKKPRIDPSLQLLRHFAAHHGYDCGARRSLSAVRNQSGLGSDCFDLDVLNVELGIFSFKPATIELNEIKFTSSHN